MEKLSQLNMNKLFLVFVFEIIVAGFSFGQDRCVTIGDIYREIQNIKQVTYREARIENFSKFDFTNFTASGKDIGDDYFEIAFDSANNIVRIDHNESNLRLTNFRISVYYFTNFRIYTYQQKATENSFHPIVFVFDKSSNKHYLLNLKEQVGAKQSARVLFDSFPYSKIESLSAIMILRPDFYPKDFVRIHRGKIFMYSVFNYSDSITVESETARLINVSKEIVITKTTCLSEIDKIEDIHCDYSMTLQPSGNPKYRKVPFWVYGGAHLYR